MKRFNIAAVLVCLGWFLLCVPLISEYQGQDSHTMLANELTDNVTVALEAADYETVNNVTRIEILEVRELDVGIFISIVTDYGLETQLNFAKPVTDDHIEMELRRFYNNHRPENQTISAMKQGDKITW